MQIKKFEAPTIQEALETIKRELGPEAIILQTKKYKRGFGLMSRASVEVTAAVSERSLQKKQYAEAKVHEPARETLKKMPANRQAEFYEKSLNQAMATTRDRVDVRGRTPSAPAQAKAQPQRPAQSQASRAGGSLSNGTGAVATGRPAFAQPGAKHPSHAQAQVQAQTQAQSQVQAQAKAKAQATKPAMPRVTSTRYIDIDPEDVPAPVVTDTVAGFAKTPNMTVEEELRHLKRMIEEMRTNQENAAPSGSGANALLPNSALSRSLGAEESVGVLGTPALQDAFEQLVINGVDKRHAFALMKQVGFELGAHRSASPDEVLDQLAAEIMRSTEVHAPLSAIRPRGERAADLQVDGSGNLVQGPRVIALVGPTGVGKTTTVAKLASEALLRRNLRVGLINLDSYKVAAFDQLGTYGKILNVPFRSVSDAQELAAAIQDFQTLDLILIDTTGRSQRDPNSLKELHEMLKLIPDLRSHLVLSVTTRDTELYDMASRFSLFKPDGIIVSKLDEATIYGSIYNVSQKVKLPLLYFTTGQRVPEDIEEASRERVASLILEI